MNAVECLQIAQVVDHCVKWLKAQNIKVLRAEGTTVQPRIIVKHSEQCDRFEDIVRAYERSERGEKHCAWVFRFGCQIKWVEPPSNPHRMGGAA